MRYSEDLSFCKIIRSFLVIFILSARPLISFAQEDAKSAIIQLEFTEDGSNKYITAKLNDYTNDSIGQPLEEYDLYFYVERTFSLLPIGDVFNTTDENGEVTIEFPTDLPGDAEGNVRIIVKLEDADDYANAETSEVKNWGIPTPHNESRQERSLWAAGANAPISLLILTNSLIAAAWGIIFYILYRFYQISKI